VPLTHGKKGAAYKWDAALASVQNESGVYVLRDRESGEVLYVGESHTGRLYRTMLRHFHDSSGKFETLGEWVHHAPTRLDYKVFIAPAAAVPDLERDAVEYFEPKINKLLVADADGGSDDEVPF
jgi:excinuclease UvrABC nuclease subunit